MKNITTHLAGVCGLKDKEGREAGKVVDRRQPVPLVCQCAKHFSVVLLQARGAPGPTRNTLGILASISFTLPCRPAVQCLNQYFLKLWQEEGFSLGSHQSSGAFFQTTLKTLGNLSCELA